MKTLSLILLTSLPALAQTNLEIMDRLIKAEQHGKILMTFKAPTTVTNTSVDYSFPELELRPRDVLYFYVPEELSGSPLSQIGFSHRQSGHATERDMYPGLTSALVYDKTKANDEFRYWGGHSSGKLGAKFAEYRSSPEFDALYEWPLKGHKGFISRERSYEPVHPNVVRIQNTGTDNVYFSQLYVEIMPRPSEIEEVLVFTPNSAFGDSLTMKGRNYGGGQKLRGLFPKALRLSSRDHSEQPSLPANYRIEKNKLIVDLPAGKKFSHLEIMCGDTHPDQVKNQDSGWGSLGSAQVSVSIENEETKTTRLLLDEKNVGPEGVITAAEIDPKAIIGPGDKLIITNKWKKSTLYIMALKLGLNNAK